MPEWGGDEMKLEVGCGYSYVNDIRTGKYRFNPKIVGADVVYLELHTPEVQEWKQSCIGWIVGDAHHLPFRDSCFKEVVASHVMEHLDDPIRFLKECYRILKVKGFLRLFLPNFLSVNARRDPSHTHVFNAISLVLTMRRIGFRVYFDYKVGSLLPNFIRKLLIIIMNFLSEEIRLHAEKVIHDAT